jgi:hypothetical protein
MTKQEVIDKHLTGIVASEIHRRIEYFLSQKYRYGDLPELKEHKEWCDSNIDQLENELKLLQ